MSTAPTDDSARLREQLALHEGTEVPDEAIAKYADQCRRQVPSFDSLSAPRRHALVDLAYWLGPRSLAVGQFREALEKGDFQAAADGVLALGRHRLAGSWRHRPLRERLARLAAMIAEDREFDEVTVVDPGAGEQRAGEKPSRARGKGDKVAATAESGGTSPPKASMDEPGAGGQRARKKPARARGKADEPAAAADSLGEPPRKRAAKKTRAKKKRAPAAEQVAEAAAQGADDDPARAAMAALGLAADTALSTDADRLLGAAIELAAQGNGLLSSEVLLAAFLARVQMNRLVDDLSWAFVDHVRERGGDRFSEALSRHLSSPPTNSQPTPKLSDTPPERIAALRQTENFRAILAIASETSRETGSPSVFPEHLVVALLSRRASVALRLLAENGVDLAEIFAALRERVAANPDDGQRRAWDAVLDRLLDDAGAPPRLPIEIRNPRFSSDDAGPDADDLLDVEREAAAFARYLAGTNIEPPLAVALFGDWGSGKTFLMNKIRGHVERLADAAREASASGEETAYHGDIVQIEFNAWHYMEANLWASLVEHIFTRLDGWLRDEKCWQTETVEALFAQLDTARELESEARAELQVARNARAVAIRNVRRLRKGLDAAEVHRKQLDARDVWKAVARKFQDETSRQPLADQLADASEALGIPRLEHSARDLHEVLAESHRVSGRARLLLTSIMSRCRSPGPFLGLAALLVLVPLAVSLAIGALGESAGLLGALRGGVAEFGALLAALSVWVGRGVSIANRALDGLAGADATLSGILEAETQARSRAIAEAENDAATFADRVEQAEQALAEAKKRMIAVREEIRQGTVRARLNRFIRERVASGDYSKHLGLVAMVRKDFERLSNLMLEERVSQADEQRIADAGVDIADLRVFKRVVLYVDDLDRCPPDKVVDVLQAIHLLLAFKLFVVVVGVDARWVSRALKERYPLLLNENVAVDLERVRREPAAGGAPQAEEGEREDAPGSAAPISELAASSHDYLEKIFQVPYWVRPMDRDASKVFVRGLAKRDLPAAAAKAPPDEASAGGAGGAERGSTAAAPAGAGDALASSQDGDGDASDVVAAEGTAAHGAGGTDGDAGGGGDDTDRTGDARERSAAEIVINPDQMTLSEHEVDFMEALAPHVGRSPRRSKRFVNVYRLIKAGLTGTEYASFVGEAGDGVDYRAVLAQLAIVTGAPISAPTYFEMLVDIAGRSKPLGLADLREELSRNRALGRSLEWHDVQGALDVLAGSFRDPGKAGKAGRTPAPLPTAVDREVLARMRHWARRVMRYSFTSRPV